MKKKLLSLLLIGAMVFALTACGGGGDDGSAEDETSGESESKGELIVGTSPDFPPFEFIDEEPGEMMGFDLELIEAIAEDQGYTVTFTSLNFDSLTAAVQSGSIDVVASGCTIRPDADVSYTDKYITAGLALAVRSDDTAITGEADLQGKTAAVQSGTTGHEKANELYEAGVLTEVRSFNTVDVVMQELINGGVDCVINDLPVTQAYIAQQPDQIKIVGVPLNSEDYGFVVANENTELLADLNAGLANVMENGIYDELFAKYIAAEVGEAEAE